MCMHFLTPHVYAAAPCNSSKWSRCRVGTQELQPSGLSRCMILDVADWRDLERKLAEVKAVPKDVPRRLAYQRWAAEWGCKEYKPGADWQGWRKAAEAKFATRLKAAGLRKVKAAAEVIDVEAAPRELVDSPQRAASANKARHTPPASQRSSSVQPESGARRRILVVEEEDDEEIDAEELAALGAARARDQQQCKEAWEARDAAAAAAEVMKEAVSNNPNPNTNPSPTPPTGPNTNPNPPPHLQQETVRGERWDAQEWHACHHEVLNARDAEWRARWVAREDEWQAQSEAREAEWQARIKRMRDERTAESLEDCALQEAELRARQAQGASLQAQWDAREAKMLAREAKMLAELLALRHQKRSYKAQWDAREAEFQAQLEGKVISAVALAMPMLEKEREAERAKLEVEREELFAWSDRERAELKETRDRYVGLAAAYERDREDLNRIDQLVRGPDGELYCVSADEQGHAQSYCCCIRSSPRLHGEY